MKYLTLYWKLYKQEKSHVDIYLEKCQNPMSKPIWTIVGNLFVRRISDNGGGFWCWISLPGFLTNIDIDILLFRHGDY